MATPNPDSEIVAEMVAFEDRSAGTDAERRAAGRLLTALGEQGRRGRLEAIYVHPQQAAIGLLHCLAAVAGSLLATLVPAAGFAIVLLAATSFYLDLTGRAYLLRRLFFRRSSQNVYSPPPDTDRPTVLLCASVDAPRSGAAYNPGSLRVLEVVRRLLPGRWGPTGLVFWSIALLLPPLAARMAGLDSDWIAALQLPQTLALILAAFLFGEIALSSPSPAANHNAAGVASALAAARRLDADPPGALSVGVLLSGGGAAGGGGMRAFLRRHREELPKERTWLLSFEGTGRGRVRVPLAASGPLPLPFDPGLIEIASLLADEADGAGTIADAAPGDAYAATTRGYAALAVTARERESFHPPGFARHDDLPDALDESSIASSADLAVSVVRVLDRQLERERGAHAPPGR